MQKSATKTQKMILSWMRKHDRPIRFFIGIGPAMQTSGRGGEPVISMNDTTEMALCRAGFVKTADGRMYEMTPAGKAIADAEAQKTEAAA